MNNVIFKTSWSDHDVREQFSSYTAIGKPPHYSVGVLSWLRSHCEGQVVISIKHFYFEYASDALMYKLSIGLTA